MSGRPGLMRHGSSVAAAKKTIVLVTGGNSGIGYEIVKSLAWSRLEFQILLGCRDTTKGEMAVAAMGAPLNVNPIQLDVTDDQSIEHCYRTIDQLFGRLDILINNAGTDGEDSTDAGTSPSPRVLWQSVFNLNCTGAGVLTDKLIPLLEHSQKPKIIFISAELGSIQGTLKEGKLHDPNLIAFSASKSAVNMMAVQYALKHPRFKVNACCPGYRATNSNDAEPTGNQDPALGAVNAVRLATEENGATATFSNNEGQIPW